MRILTIDLGLGSLKVCLWQEGICLARLQTPVVTQTDGNAAEQDAGKWWTEAAALVRRIVSESGAGMDGIAVTGQMHALVLVDGEGAPLAPVSIVTDRRARAACREIEAEFGITNLLRLTGGRLDPTCALAKAWRFHRENNNTWQAARFVLPPKDFLRFQLTGEAITDPIDAAGTLLYDLEAGDWQPDLCKFVGLSPERLPEIRPTASIAGRLSRRAAEELGLPSGIPVAVGGGDDIESLAAGAIYPGDLFEHLGTTGSLYAASDRLIFDESALVETYPDVVPGRFLLGGSTSAAGLALRWALSLLGKNDADDGTWAEMETILRAMVKRERPGTVLFLPYLAGERAPLWNSDRRAAFLGLRRESQAQDALEAVLEGIAFSLRAVLDVLDRVLAPAGILAASNRVHSSGPLGAGATFGQIRANIYHREIIRCDVSEDTTSVAAMLLATSALTGEDPFTLAARRFAARPPLWLQNPGASAARYERAYQRYHHASDALASIDKKSAEEAW